MCDTYIARKDFAMLLFYLYIILTCKNLVLNAEGINATIDQPVKIR